MDMPPGRRRAVTVLAGALFVFNVFAITLAIRSAVWNANSSAQYAGSAQTFEEAPLFERIELYGTATPMRLDY